MIEIDEVVIDDEAFLTDYKDGEAYYQCALTFKNQGMRPSLVFNIASVALERYLVAICDLYGEDPRNHNYITLMKTAETVVDIPPELNKRIKAMDWIFGICSIDEYRHPNPDEADMCRNTKKTGSILESFAMENSMSRKLIRHHTSGTSQG